MGNNGEKSDLNHVKAIRMCPQINTIFWYLAVFHIQSFYARGC